MGGERREVGQAEGLSWSEGDGQMREGRVRVSGAGQHVVDKHIRPMSSPRRQGSNACGASGPLSLLS